MMRRFNLVFWHTSKTLLLPVGVCVGMLQNFFILIQHIEYIDKITKLLNAEMAYVFKKNYTLEVPHG